MRRIASWLRRISRRSVEPIEAARPRCIAPNHTAQPGPSARSQCARVGVFRSRNSAGPRATRIGSSDRAACIAPCKPSLDRTEVEFRSWRRSSVLSGSGPGVMARMRLASAISSRRSGRAAREGCWQPLPARGYPRLGSLTLGVISHCPQPTPRGVPIGNITRYISICCRTSPSVFRVILGNDGERNRLVRVPFRANRNPTPKSPARRLWITPQ